MIAYRLIARERADAGLVQLRGWVGRNSPATLAVLLAAIGVGLLVKAVVEITQI